MCHACDNGNPKLVKLECNHCQFNFFIVDEPNIVEDVTCPKCRAGVGVVVLEEM